jgi:alpha-tubulin suppressor-like RCC1 family protein
MVGVVKPSSISTASIVSSPKVNLQNLVPSSIASGEVHGSPTVIKQPRQIQSIAKIVKHRLPQYVQSDFPRFIDFLEKYYEWMEIRGNALGLSKDLPRLQDLDTTEDPFLHSLQKEVMSRFPKELYVDPANPNNRVKIQNAIKNIVQFYGAKGTERAYKYLFRLILGAEIDFYYPRVDMLRPSDGKWIQNYSVRVEMPTNSADTPFAFINKKIIGQNSQSSAFVEYAIKLEIGLNVVYELFLNRSSITGEFYPGETLYSDEAPNVFANPVTCVTGFKLFDKGSNYSIGTEIVSNFQNFNIQDFKATVSTVNTLGNVTKVDIVSPGFKIPPTAFSEVKIGERTYNNILVYEPDGDNQLHIIPQVGTIIKYKGYFLNDDGKLSDAKFIQDSFYYQQFSYVIKVSESFDFYESFVKDLIHPSGLKLFGNFLSENFISSETKVQNNLQITWHNEVEYNDISFKPLDVELKLEVDPNIQPELDEYQLESLVRYRNGASLNSIDRFKFTYKPNGGNDEDRLLYSGNSNYWKTDFANYQIKDFFDIIVGDFWMKPWLRTKIQPEPILKDPLCDTASPFPSGSKQLFTINIHTQEIFGTPSILSGATSILTSSINSNEQFGSVNIDLGLSPIVLPPEETLYTWGYVGNGTLPKLQSTPINEDNLIPYSDVILKGGFGSGELLMALKQDGQLWEDNIFAGLTFNRDSNFVKITGVQYVGGGNYGNAGIKDDGTLWTWPHYLWYESSTHTAPTLLNADTDWVSLDSGINHFLALKSDGTLWSWGRNVEGQLGDGTTVDSITPIQVGTDTDWSFIAAGGYASFAIKNDGTLWKIGTTITKVLIDPTWFKSSHYAWGQFMNDWSINYGNINTVGTFEFTTSIHIPISGTYNFQYAADNLGSYSIAGQTWTSSNNFGSSSNISITLTAGTHVLVASYINEPHPNPDNPSGIAIKITDESNNVIWTTLDYLNEQQGFNCINVSTSGGHHLAIKSNGTLWAWGDNTTGQLGDGTTISKAQPIQIDTDDDWTEIATGFIYGGGYSYAIKSDKSLWSWGWGSRLLSDSSGTDISTTPQKLTTYLKWNRIQTHAFQSGGILDVTSPKPIFCNGISTGEAFGNTIATPEETNLTPTNTLWGWHRDNFIKKVTGRSDVSYGVPVEQRDNTWSDFNLFGRMFSAIKSDQTNWAGRFDGSMDVLGSAWIKTSITNSGAPWNDGATIISIRNDGTLWSNTYNGQFYNGALNPSPNPTLFDSNIWTDIDAGVNHFLGLKSDGTLWAWGRNAEGQLGDGTNVDRLTPVQIGTDSNWSSIFAIHLRSFAIKVDGTLWAWGHNASGQLGDGTTVDRTTPTQVGTDTDWKTVASGGWHTLGVKTNGTLWSWGTQYTGELGIGSITSTVLEPIQVGTETDWDDVAGAYVIFNNAAYSFALKVDGSLWAWGSNYRLPITSSFTEFVTTPEKITTYLTWNKIEANGWHVGALLDASSPEPIFCGGISTGESFGQTELLGSNGLLYTWGDALYGVLGNGSYQTDALDSDKSSPTLISSGVKWKDISVGYQHMIALKLDGTIWSWGLNTNGQLGKGTTTNNNANGTPAQIGSDSDWTYISAGNYHSLAIKSNGTLWTWGAGLYGRLGVGDTTGRTSPTQIGSDTNWSSVSGGQFHTVAIKSNGTLWAWGYNVNGRLGDGTTTQRNSPVQIGSDTNWMKVSAGNSHTIALKNNGTLWAWGYNAYGQLGDGTTIQKTSPIQIGTDTDWKEIYAGYQYTFAIKNNGTLWAWGWNNYRVFGNGTTTDSLVPIQIGSDTNWRLIEGRDLSTFAIKTDGTLWAAGTDNMEAPLGLGVLQNTSVLTFTQIGTDTDWLLISGGGQGQAAAIKRN